MRRVFLVHNTPRFKGWETCFRFMMEKADIFRIVFQGSEDASDADDLLNAGKREFLTLPAISISPYEGMENSIAVTGTLNRAAQELFLTFMAPAFHGYKPHLWSFQLSQGNDVLLRVEDFTVGLLFLKESELADLLARGIDGADLEEIDGFPQGAHQPDTEVVGWQKGDLSSLANQFQKRFLADQQDVPTSAEDSR